MQPLTGKKPAKGFQKGRAKTGGRKKGAKNKITIALEEGLHEKAKRLGVDPFEVLCLFAKGDHKALDEPFPIDPRLRLRAAGEAAEYLYPKRRAIEMTGKDGSPISLAMAMDPAERLAKLAQLAELLNATAE